jgi:DDE superfamily endonuclease
MYWIQHVFDPLTKSRANQRPRVLICDGLGTHESLEVMKFCFENNIILCRLPSHTSHKLQPCDVGVFGPLKTAYREQVERLYREGANTVGKQHFTSLYSRARDQVFTSRNILSG